MHGTLSYTQLAASNYFNIARDLSWLNQKNEEVTSRDGHVYAYICDITIASDVATFVNLFTAPNTWKMRNSFRKWHAYRDMMFSEAGVTDSEKGRYGKTIRPHLNNAMKDATLKTPVVVDGVGTPTLGDWTYTEIAATPGFVEDAIGTEGGSIVDTYDLSICGLNTVSSTTALGTERYSNVGMIHSYNQDRMEVVTPSAGESIEGQNNPLALLRYKGASAGEVMDIVHDQETEFPPYDIRDNGDSVYPVYEALAQISPGWNGTSSIPSVKVLRNVLVPAGVCLLTASAAGSASASAIQIKCVGKVLCKDLA